jgi:hypothetical protein
MMYNILIRVMNNEPLFIRCDERGVKRVSIIFRDFCEREMPEWAEFRILE